MIGGGRFKKRRREFLHNLPASREPSGEFQGPLCALNADAASSPSADSAQSRKQLYDFVKGGGLPAWVSAVFAALMFALVLYAYETWKNQEAAKRKADFAIDALKAAQNLRQCFDDATFIFLWHPLDEKEIKKIVSILDPGRDKCTSQFAHTKASAVFARALLDVNATDKLNKYEQFMWDRLSLINELALEVDDPPPDRKLPTTRERIVELLELLGARDSREEYKGLAPDKKAEIDNRKKERDPKPRLDKLEADLERSLAPYITFGK